MTIRDIDKYVERLWDWGPLDDCFPGNIRATDVDMLVEINHHFLLIEAKGEGVEVPRGQCILFDRLTQLPSFCVIVLWGSPPFNPVQMCVWGKSPIEDCDRFDVIDTVKAWVKDSCKR